MHTVEKNTIMQVHPYIIMNTLMFKIKPSTLFLPISIVLFEQRLISMEPTKVLKWLILCLLNLFNHTTNTYILYYLYFHYLQINVSLFLVVN